MKKKNIKLTIKFNEELNEYINNFINKIKQDIPEENLSYLYDNIRWLKLTVKKRLDKSPILGSYNILKNKIVLYGCIELDTLYHELFHMCSNKYDKKNKTSGLECDLGSDSIGIVINEGYTELLLKRYFPEVYEEGSYDFGRKIAESLEQILTKENMQKHYFNENLYGLIIDLKEYYTIEEISTFLTSTDFIHYYYRSDKVLNNIEADIILSTLDYIICFLITGYCKKLNKLNISNSKKQKLIKEFYYNINFKIKNKDLKLISTDLSVVDEIISKNLKRHVKISRKVLKNREYVL